MHDVRDRWREIVDSLLRPSRPELTRCLEARAAHRAARAAQEEARARMLADCVARIESARAEVFASGNGVVSKRMTELEREWRVLSRVDADAGMMQLWARMAPPSWIDRKLWRGNATAAQLDVAVGLAADPAGVDAVSVCVLALQEWNKRWGVAIGPRVAFRPFEGDGSVATALLAPARQVAERALAAQDYAVVARERADRVEAEIRDAVLARFPSRPGLAADVAGAAFVEAVWRAASQGQSHDPTTPFAIIWRAGYSLACANESGVSIEVPPL